MKYRYQCSNEACGARLERVVPIREHTPDTTCEYCGSVAPQVIEAPAVMTGGMFNQPQDVTIGRDAAARWADIHTQQETRDKVRKETKSTGLTADGFQRYKPITKAQKDLRTRGMNAVSRDGFKDQTGIKQRP